jgi:hypothetical protein
MLIQQVTSAIQSAANAAYPRDLYWPTVIQAIGTLVMALATGGLVWATNNLVSATKKLSEVGEKTWKSSIPAVLWIFLDEGRHEKPEGCNLQIRNATEVDARKVFSKVFLCIYDLAEDGELRIKLRREESRIIRIGDIEASSLSEKYPMWESAREALQYRASIQGLPASSIAVLRVVIHCAHGITGRSYVFGAEYKVEDLQNLAFRLTKLGDINSEVL